MLRVKLLLDENSLGLAEAVDRHNLSSDIHIDLIAVGDDESIPRMAGDHAILIWAEEHDRILITRDRSTMPSRLKAHLASGRASPGVFLLKRGASVPEILEHLALATEAGTSEDFANQVEWIP